MEPTNVLVIEDSPTMRQLLVFALKRLPGLRVVEATDGVDALKKVSAERFQLVITDINMPIMDGLKLVGMLRKDPATQDIPIIVVTTEGADEDRDRALALGANAYLAKPVQTGRLVELCRQLLPGRLGISQA